MSTYFKNTYDPSLEEIQNIFPDYSYGTKESWLESYKSANLVLDNYIDFTLNKMRGVTTSYKLSETQKLQLHSLKLNNDLSEEEGWESYCNIVTPKQMGYVGI